MAKQQVADRIDAARILEAGRAGLRKSSKVLRRFSAENPLGLVSGLFLVLIGLMAIFASTVAPKDPLFIDVDALTTDPSTSYVLGTDYSGRDLLSRIIHGTRISLMVAIISVSLGTALGGVIGISSAYIGGRYDMISQRILEIFMAFPALILAMILVAAFGRGLETVIIAITVTRVPIATRVIRSVALGVKEFDYVLAARAIGASAPRIMFRHIAPQCIAPFLILGTAQMGTAIIVEASLSFLGAGINPPTPTWGNMLGGAVGSTLIPHWPLVVFPGVAITITVLAFNLFGDSIRDFLDPKLRGRIVVAR